MTDLSQAHEDPEDYEGHRPLRGHDRVEEGENGRGEEAQPHGVFAAVAVGQEYAGYVGHYVAVIEGRQDDTLSRFVPVIATISLDLKHLYIVASSFNKFNLNEMTEKKSFNK